MTLARTIHLAWWARLMRDRKNPDAPLEWKGPRDDFDLEALRNLSRERDLARLARREAAASGETSSEG